jgi:MFS family permease
VIASLIAGWISDRTGKRKIVAIVAGVIMAAGLIMLSFGNTEGWFLVAVAVIGFGQGVYLAIDVAIVSELISSDNDRGKDMGVLNIANTLPQSIVPIVAPFILAIGSAGGENYPLLFIFGGIVALIGGVMVQALRKVS